MKRTRVATIAGDPGREIDLAAALGRRGDVELVLRCLDRVELLAAAGGASLDAVICVGYPRWLDPRCTDALVAHGVARVGVAADPLEAEELRRLRFEPAPSDVSVDRLIALCAATDPGGMPPEGDAQVAGRLVAVWGPKGSPGRTTLAIELAAEVAAAGSSVALIDADLSGGDIAQMLGVADDGPSVIWASQAASKDGVGPAELDAALSPLDEGFALVSGINRADLWRDVSHYGWKRLLDALRSRYQFIFCDLGSGLGTTEPETDLLADREAVARETLTTADTVVAVCRGDAVGVKNFLWAFQSLTELVDPGRIVIALNQTHPRDEAEVAYLIRKYTGKKPTACLRWHSEAFWSARDRGVSVRRTRFRNDIAGPIRDLTSRCGIALAPRGVLARLSGRAS
ncbi:MAG TPA: P-loop NTPase [Actinomycetota bacterium]|nr:P-loop NTPase [Actinomycetota bacterium]